MSRAPSIGLQQTTTPRMSPALWQAIGLLQMDLTELARFGQAQSGDNPFLRIDLPAGRPAAAGGLGRQAAAGFEDGVAAASSLTEHVSRQIEQRSWADGEKAGAYLFLEGLAPSGWLDALIDAIARRAGCAIAIAIAIAIAERILGRLQEAEPPGLFARSLSECLSLQLADQGLLSREARAVLAAIDRAASVDVAGIARPAGLRPRCAASWRSCGRSTRSPGRASRQPTRSRSRPTCSSRRAQPAGRSS